MEKYIDHNFGNGKWRLIGDLHLKIEKWSKEKHSQVSPGFDWKVIGVGLQSITYPFYVGKVAFWRQLGIIMGPC